MGGDEAIQQSHWDSDFLLFNISRTWASWSNQWALCCFQVCARAGPEKQKNNAGLWEEEGKKLSVPLVLN